MRVFVFILLAFAVFEGTVAAHHSFGAEYDNNKPVTLTGSVSKVEWTNPHVHIFVDSKAEDGTVTAWEFELGSPNGLLRGGWTRNSLKPGSTVSIEGFRAKDGTNVGLARTITVNGKKMFAGSAESDAPAK